MNEFPRRVHIVPFGPETDRITKPAIEMRADLVVLIHYDEMEPTYEDLQTEVRTRLETEGIEYTEPEYRGEDKLFRSIDAVSREINKYADDLVYVNLAVGSKVMAIGSMMAAMSADDVKPYYVKATDSGSVAPTPATNVEEVQSIPRFPMDRPEMEHVALLEFIERSSHKHELGDLEPYQVKSTLYEFGEAAELPFMKNVDEDATSKAKFNRLDNHIIRPLTERGYVEIEEVGQHHRVFLTDLGTHIIEGFGYLVPDSVRESIDNSSHTEDGS